MDKKQLTKKLVNDLMFYGCQSLTTDKAIELAENILNNKVPFFTATIDSELEDKVAIQAAANKSAAIEVMDRFLPEKPTDSEAIRAEAKHWHKVFISSAMGGGKGVAESIEDATEAISSIYGALDFELVLK